LRSRREDLVVDRVRAGVAAQSTLGGLPDAQHPDDVRAIGVQCQLAAVPVRALAAILTADVEDVAEPIAHGALRDRAAEMRAEAEEEHAELVRRVALARKLSQDDEAAAAKNLVAPGSDVGRDRRKRE